jgi:hypothetical protein
MTERPMPRGDDVPPDLGASIHRMLREGHKFWEAHQHSPGSDEMSAALTDLYMACKRHGIERAASKAQA